MWVRCKSIMCINDLQPNMIFLPSQLPGWYVCIWKVGPLQSVQCMLDSYRYRHVHDFNIQYVQSSALSPTLSNQQDGSHMHTVVAAGSDSVPLIGRRSSDSLLRRLELGKKPWSRIVLEHTGTLNAHMRTGTRTFT